MIAGGASLAPSRWSLPAEATTARSKPLVLVHGSDHRRAEDQELGVLVRRVARVEQVTVLARA